MEATPPQPERQIDVKDTLKNAIALGALAASLIAGDVHAGRMHNEQDRCATWAIRIDAGVDSKRMHQMGCTDHPTAGRYHRDRTTCAYLMYRAVEDGRNPVTAVKRAGFQYNEDGTCEVK